MVRLLIIDVGSVTLISRYSHVCLVRVWVSRPLIVASFIAGCSWSFIQQGVQLAAAEMLHPRNMHTPERGNCCYSSGQRSCERSSVQILPHDGFTS